MIDEYRPGSITIEGKIFTTDIETDWNGEIFQWNGHEGPIQIEDVGRAVEKRPETIIVGAGQNGSKRLAEEEKSYMKGKGIELIVDKTEEAVKTFNILKEDSLGEEGRQCRVIGLSCL